jgi:cytochrome c5
MPIDWIQRNPTRTMAAAPFLALMLFASGCSKQETAAPEEAPSAAAPAAEVAEQETAPVAEAPEPAMDEPVAEAPEPAMDEPVAEAAAATTAAAVDGEAIYKQSCMACHAAGVAGAPKLGDSQAWSPRIAKGNEALVQSVTNGLNAMPPKGGCMNCSDDELRGAVEYMLSQGS